VLESSAILCVFVYSGQSIQIRKALEGPPDFFEISMEVQKLLGCFSDAVDQVVKSFTALPCNVRHCYDTRYETDL
jgi:hypothetical protein